MRLTTARIFVFALLILMCCTAGCSSIKHATAKDSYITKEIKSYTFSTDLASTMAQARALLFSSGYQVVQSTPNSIETAWGQIETHTMRRYLVTGVTVSGGCQVNFDYYDETNTPNVRPATSTGRDYVMLFELIKRMEPSNWSSINSAAEAYANAHD